MSAPRQEVTTTSTDSVPQPIQSETPTMRLGSMLQALRDKTRQEQLNPREPVSDGRAGFDARFDGDDSEQRTLSPKELHAFERIPRRWQPIAVCIAGLAVLIVGAATRPSVRALLARQTTVSTPSRPQAGEPAHLAAVNVACPCAASSAPTAVAATPVVPTPVEATPVVPTSVVPTPVMPAPVAMPAFAPLPPLTLHILTNPSVASATTPTPRPSRPPESTPRAAAPLRGYAWSVTANALVPVEPESPTITNVAAAVPSAQH